MVAWVCEFVYINNIFCKIETIIVGGRILHVRIIMERIKIN